jgi:hypothetical protein
MLTIELSLHRRSMVQVRGKADREGLQIRPQATAQAKPLAMAATSASIGSHAAFHGWLPV